MPNINFFDKVGTARTDMTIVLLLKVIGISTDISAACKVPSAVFIKLVLLYLSNFNSLIRANEPFPNIVQFAPESSKPTILLLFMKTST